MVIMRAAVPAVRLRMEQALTAMVRAVLPIWKAAALTAIDLKKYAKMSMVCYLAMGWAVVAIIGMTVRAMGWAGFWWLLGGGLCYTFGAVLYGLGKKHRYMHSVFHVFVDLGSLMQAIAILKYVL